MHHLIVEGVFVYQAVSRSVTTINTTTMRSTGSVLANTHH